MCSPLPPVVLTTLSRSNAASRRRISNAPSTTRAHGTAGSGSRSKITRSGYSISSTQRVPRVDLEDAHLRQLEDARQIARDHVVGGLRPFEDPVLLQRARRHQPGVLHEEAGRLRLRIGRHPVRAAKQRQRPARHVRQHEVRDRLVVLHQLQLREPARHVRPQHPLRMRQPKPLRQRRRVRTRLLSPRPAKRGEGQGEGSSSSPSSPSPWRTSPSPSPPSRRSATPPSATPSPRSPAGTPRDGNPRRLPRCARRSGCDPWPARRTSSSSSAFRRSSGTRDRSWPSR